jgi:hypothetical protein
VLTDHFAQNQDNLSLPPEDQLQYINYPHLIWWRVDFKDVTARNIRDFEQPIDFFNALFDKSILNHIAKKTGTIVHNHFKSQVTQVDLKKFFGVELMRGYVGVRNIEMLWSQGEFQVSYPNKENALPKNHWFALSNNIVYDPKKIHKKLVDLFKKFVVPGYNVTVDEVRIPCAH